MLHLRIALGVLWPCRRSSRVFTASGRSCDNEGPRPRERGRSVDARISVMSGKGCAVVRGPIQLAAQSRGPGAATRSGDGWPASWVANGRVRYAVASGRTVRSAPEPCAWIGCGAPRSPVPGCSFLWPPWSAEAPRGLSVATTGRIGEKKRKNFPNAGDRHDARFAILVAGQRAILVGLHLAIRGRKTRVSVAVGCSG